MRGSGWGWLVLWLACAGARAEEASGPSDAPTALELEAQVERWLSEGVEVSVPASRWRELGEPGTRALIQVFERSDAPRYVRLRALSALGSMRNARARAYLRELVRGDASFAPHLKALHPARSSTVLRRALVALAEHAPEDVPTREVAPCLEHRDPAVRHAAVRVLSQMRSADAKAALRERVEAESSPQVRRAIHKALATEPATSSGAKGP